MEQENTIAYKDGEKIQQMINEFFDKIPQANFSQPLGRNWNSFIVLRIKVFNENNTYNH